MALFSLLFKPNNKFCTTLNYFKNLYCTALKESSVIREQIPYYMQLNDEWTVNHAEIAQNLLKDMTVHENYLTEIEENNLFKELEPYLKNLRYEFDHWDDAIHGYRETERLNWNENNTATLNRLREFAFPKTVAQLKHVHVLDLAAKGFIKPHIDAVRFCGNTIAGLSLLSDSIMRLVHDKYKNLNCSVLLKRRSLYIMKDSARYDYTHEILKDEESLFKNEKITRSRRISVICRNEPVREVEK